jgi:LmbE family N-acetylglucosaminyl deacetylase
MLSLALSSGSEPLERVLAVGCHADDIEIGCGGALLTLTRALPGLQVTWLVLSAAGDREREARESAAAFLAGAGKASVEVHGFRDAFLPYLGGDVKDVFVDLASRVQPQLVFTHAREDFHQDHRFAWELTWSAFRDSLILEYEVPKVDGDLGRPNVYVPLLEVVAQEKIELLHRHFPSQTGKQWFDDDTFRGLMRLRGVEANAEERFAEAFTCRKLPLRP